MQPQITDDKNGKTKRDELAKLIAKNEKDESEQWIKEMKTARDAVAALNDAEKEKLLAKNLLSAADERIKNAEERMQKNKAGSKVNVSSKSSKTCTIEKNTDGSYSIAGGNPKVIDKSIHDTASKLGIEVKKVKNKDGSTTYSLSKNGKALTSEEMQKFMAELYKDLKNKLGKEGIDVKAGDEFAKELSQTKTAASNFEQPPPISGVSSTS